VFETYTDSARRAIFFARFEAGEYGAKDIDGEHLLLGVAREIPDFAKVYGLNSGTYDELKQAITAVAPTRPSLPTSVDMPVNPKLKRAFAFAHEEALGAGRKWISPGYLLLGLLREDDSFGAQLLQERGATLETIRETAAREPDKDIDSTQKIVNWPL